MKIFNKAPQLSALEVPRTWDDDLLSVFLKGAHVRDPQKPDKITVEHSIIVSGAKTHLTSDGNKFDNELVVYGHAHLSRSDRETHIERNSTYLQVVLEILPQDPQKPDYLGWVHMGNHGQSIQKNRNNPFATMYAHLCLSANQRNDFEKSLGFLRAENQMPKLVLRLNVDKPSETSSAENSSFTINRFWLESLTIFNKEWLSKNLVFKEEFL